MEKRFLTACFVVVLMSLTARGQQLEQWLAQSKSAPEEVHQATLQLKSFVESLREPGLASEKHLAKVFRKVHANYLKKYEAYAGLDKLFENGTYDCLTATALFSEVLSGLDYSFRIIETNYHIFILVTTQEQVVLMETTDRARGFVTDEKEIAKRTAGYRTNDLVNKTSGETYQYRYRCNLYQEVSVDHLSGLLVFNQAVKSYNTGDWLASARSLEVAHGLYATGRCYELSDILVKTLVTRKDISFELRRACMEHLMPLLIRSSGQVATAGN